MFFRNGRCNAVGWQNIRSRTAVEAGYVKLYGTYTAINAV